MATYYVTNYVKTIQGHIIKVAIVYNRWNIQRCAHNMIGMLTEYIRRRFAAALLPRLFVSKVPGHTTRAPPVGFELATNGIQLYALANLDNIIL